MTQSRLPWNDVAGRVADERQKELDAIRRRSDETYWSARLADRHDADCQINASPELDPRSTLEVLATPDAARHVGENAATLDRWRAERRIIGVPVGAAWLFPMFQFKDRAPRPVIARALAELPPERSPWPDAFWFVSSNSWLGGPAPMSLLDDNPDAIVWAAERERHEISG